MRAGLFVRPVRLLIRLRMRLFICRVGLAALVLTLLLPQGGRFAQAHQRPAFVQHVNGLVGQQLVPHMPGRKAHHAFQRVGVIRHLMEVGVARFQPLQNGQALLLTGFAHVDTLKTPRQRAILFKMIAELLVGGGADTAQIPGGQHGFQQIRRVHGTAGRGTRPHDGMNLVDKENGMGNVLQRLHNVLQTPFKVAAIARPGQQQAHVQRKQARLFQRGRHMAFGNAQGQPFGQRRLAHARLAHKQRIILTAAAQHFNGARQFLIPSHQRINPAFARPRREVRRVQLKRILFLFLPFLSILGHAFGAAALFQPVRNEGEHIQTFHALPLQIIAGVALLFFHDGNQQIAKLHLRAPGRTDMAHGAIQYALHGFRLHDVQTAFLRQRRKLRSKELFQLLPQQVGAGAAAFQNQLSGMIEGKGKKKMFHRQQLVPAALHFGNGAAQHVLNVVAQHGRHSAAQSGRKDCGGQHVNIFPWYSAADSPRPGRGAPRS